MRDGDDDGELVSGDACSSQQDSVEEREKERDSIAGGLTAWKKVHCDEMVE